MVGLQYFISFIVINQQNSERQNKVISLCCLISQSFLYLNIQSIGLIRFVMQKLPYRLLLSNIRQMVAVTTEKFLPLQSTHTIEPVSHYSIAIDHNGIIAKIGPQEQLSKWIETEGIIFSTVKDCSNLIALPGLVDAHTHTLFAGDRSREFDMKLNGKTYVDIYNEGLGIRYSTQQINDAPVERLVEHVEKYVRRMSRLGTTTVQIKSGYGLNAEAEVKMLRAIEIARKKVEGVIDIVATFCGAHAIPKGKTQDEQTHDVIHNQIPAVKQAWNKGQINPKFIDVFCERKFFERESSTRIMKVGKEIGLIPSFHGDELSNLESGIIAEEVGALAVSHLEYLSEESVKAMARNNIAGVLLPTTQNIQKLPVPPIKLMRQHNMIVALGSDFCPNAYCYNMTVVAHFACTNYRLTPKEVLAAATINSAYALGISNQVGSIAEGKKGDILLLDAPEWVCLMYMFGDTPIDSVIKEGVVLK